MPILKNKCPKTQKVTNGIKLVKRTSKSCWKGFERKVAQLFGTKRVPLSGSNSGHNTNSDTLHPDLYIECKVRQKLWLHTLFNDTAKKAKAENKLPVLAVKQKGEDGYLICIRPTDIEQLAELYKLSKQNE